MVIKKWLTGATKRAGVDELIARKKYAKAVELLREEFKRGRRDPRLRLQLADVLVLAGRKKEALPILTGLADEFAVEGFAAKAISVLKKIQKLQPGQKDVNEKLAHLIKERRDEGATNLSTTVSIPSQPSSAGMPAFGMEEIGMEAMEAPKEPKRVSLQAPTEPAPEELGEPEILLEPDEASGDEDGLGDELLSVIEDVLSEAPPAGVGVQARGSGSAERVESPLFTSFSEAELVAVIGGLELLSFEPGDIIITQGEAGNSMFVLTDGITKPFVRDESGHHKQVREMEEGTFFGEISILTGQPRTATVTAATRCELLELDRKTLDSITQTHPHVREVLQEFCDERLKNA